MITREDVVAQARDWKESPFKHQGRLKGVGVDCLGLVIGVAKHFELVAPDFNVTGYARSPDGVTFLALCDRYMTRIRRAEMGLGDVVVVVVDQLPQHMGIVGDYWHGGYSIIHAASRYDRVVEHRLMFATNARFCAAYRLPGVEWPR